MYRIEKTRRFATALVLVATLAFVPALSVQAGPSDAETSSGIRENFEMLFQAIDGLLGVIWGAEEVTGGLDPNGFVANQPGSEDREKQDRASRQKPSPGANVTGGLDPNG